jgi:hypothetical protein
MGEVQSLLMLNQAVHIGTTAFEMIKFMLFSLPVCPYVCPLHSGITARYEQFGCSSEI